MTPGASATALPLPSVPPMDTHLSPSRAPSGNPRRTRPHRRGTTREAQGAAAAERGGCVRCVCPGGGRGGRGGPAHGALRPQPRGRPPAPRVCPGESRRQRQLCGARALRPASPTFALAPLLLCGLVPSRPGTRTSPRPRGWGPLPQETVTSGRAQALNDPGGAVPQPDSDKARRFRGAKAAGGEPDTRAPSPARGVRDRSAAHPRPRMRPPRSPAVPVPSPQPRFGRAEGAAP